MKAATFVYAFRCRRRVILPSRRRQVLPPRKRANYQQIWNGNRCTPSPLTLTICRAHIPSSFYYTIPSAYWSTSFEEWNSCIVQFLLRVRGRRSAFYTTQLYKVGDFGMVVPLGGLSWTHSVPNLVQLSRGVWNCTDKSRCFTNWAWWRFSKAVVQEFCILHTSCKALFSFIDRKWFQFYTQNYNLTMRYLSRKA